MPTILADSFTASLAKLTNDEQKQAQLTAFTLMTEPDRPGLQFHRIDTSRDPNFWSVRVSRDIRIIVHKTGGSLMLAYVDHHDDAYAWAERRRIEAHPATGAIQIVEVRERVDEVALPAAPAQSDRSQGERRHCHCGDKPPADAEASIGREQRPSPARPPLRFCYWRRSGRIRPSGPIPTIELPRAALSRRRCRWFGHGSTTSRLTTLPRRSALTGPPPYPKMRPAPIAATNQ